MTCVALRPEVCFGDRRPTADEALAMHHDAHDSCYTARSVKTGAGSQ